MATWNATNILTGAVEKPKYFEIGTIQEIWTVALTTALASGDTIAGPTIPAGTFLIDVTVAVDELDSSTGLTWEAGYTGTLGGFVASSTVGQGAAGIQKMTVAAAYGKTFTSDTQVLVTITHVATTPVAGTMRIGVSYTGNP